MSSALPIPARNTVLWLEWRHYFADNATDRPQVILHNHSVVDMNRVAAQRGVTLGMRKHQFRALLEDPLLGERTPNPARQESWLQVCLPYSGVIQPFAENCAAIELSRHPMPFDLAMRLCQDLQKLDYGDLIAGVAPSVWLARLASGQGEVPRFFTDLERDFYPLPIENLAPLEPETLERLAFLGYKTVGDVAHIPWGVLRAQFGKSARTIEQVAHGTLPDPVQPVYPPQQIRETRYFPEPIDNQIGLEAALRDLATPLAGRLQGQQAERIALHLESESVERVAVQRQLKRPIYSRVGLLHALGALITDRKVPRDIVRISIELHDLSPAATRQKALVLKDDPIDSEVTLRTLRQAFGDRAILKGSEVVTCRRKRVLQEWTRATGWY